MIDIVTPGFDTGYPRRIAMHRFTATADGQLAHYIDDDLRATVPPEGFEAYAETHPNARPIIENLTRETRAAAALKAEADAAAAVAKEAEIDRRVQEAVAKAMKKGGK